MLGKPVARELISAGFELALLARNPEKAGAIFPEARIVQGDVFQPESLITAMQGADIVYCNLSVLPSAREKDPQTEREGMDHIIAAARQSGIKRIGYLSSLVHKYEGMNGFRWWSFRIKSRAVEKIRSSGIPFSIFYPSTFMECYPFQMLRGKKIALLGHSEYPMWFIAGSDYGRQVAAAFRLPGAESKEYVVQGPDPYTFDQGAKVFIENYGKARLGTIRAPLGIMKFLGSFNQTYNYAWHICEALNKYPERFEAGETWRELGKPVITLAGYARNL